MISRKYHNKICIHCLNTKYTWEPYDLSLPEEGDYIPCYKCNYQEYKKFDKTQFKRKI